MMQENEFWMNEFQIFFSSSKEIETHELHCACD
jgi:hypothetical protein